jgi:hypothetical protein
MNMSHNARSDAGAISSTALPEKTLQDLVVADVAGFDHDIDSRDLPKGYYGSPLFVGTLIASGLSVMAVSIMDNYTKKSSQN